jgi:transglutaminase-like putative cysteine protease
VALALDPVTIRVVDTGLSATDKLVGTVSNVTECVVETPQGNATVYQDSAGTPVRVEFAAGLSMVREPAPEKGSTASTSADAAPRLSTPSQVPSGYSPPSDFAVATAVDQGGASIAKPRDCTYLKASITRAGQPDSVVEISGVTDPEHADGTVADIASDTSLSSCLTDAPYLSLDDARIRQQAKSIAGSSTNLAEIVCKVHDWVNGHMTPSGSLGLPRAAVSVLNDPRGVCRDYAILYTALARAAGVPTRLCGGVVAFDGKFYYHGWAESYVGAKSGWVAVDPTVPGRFVDATHIAFVRGDPAAMYDLTSVVGNVKVAIIKTAE